VTSATDATVTPPDVAAAPATVPAWMLHHARARPRATAYRVKEFGRWQEVTWAQHAARVASVGRGLAQLGVGPGDRVLLLSENRLEWLVTDLAVQGLGAITVAAFPSTPTDELHELVQRIRPRHAVVEGEELLDLLLEMPESTVERIFVIDPRGIRRLEQPAASYEQLEALGSLDAVELRSGDPDLWERSVAALEPHGVASIVFTPGTTGTPKGAMLTHGNLAAAAAIGVDAYGLRAGDRIVSCMSLGEITERALSLAQATRAACTVHFGEGGDALGRDVREVEPTVLLGPPRLWAQLRERVEDGLRDAGRVKRAAFRFAIGRRRGPGRLIGRALVTGPLRRHLGLARVRVALVGGAPTPVELLEWWARLGLRAREIYALTESSGVGTVCTESDAGSGTVGRAVPGVEVRIDDAAEEVDENGAGEVLLRGAVVFAGYLDDPEATRSVLDDGWLRTGDIGKLDEQQRLSIVGRMKDIIITSSGHNVAPLPVERRLAASPFVRSAIVLGEGRPHLGALIEIDEGTVGTWAHEHRVPYTTGASLRTRPEVRELIGAWIETVNRDLAAPERVQGFALLPDELGADSGLLTATAKVRRHVITTRYADLVEEMFA